MLVRSLKINIDCGKNKRFKYCPAENTVDMKRILTICGSMRKNTWKGPFVHSRHILPTLNQTDVGC